ncbi:hypothetical protein KR009_001834 [Drosophila setifemur]|nr:hypothetical protein KR009_001834 [Drosophila setifemur]
MPRAKTVKKQAEVSAYTSNGNEIVVAEVHLENGGAKGPTKGKPLVKRAPKETEKVEDAEIPETVARGRKKLPPKDKDENIETLVVAKPKGRAKKAPAQQNIEDDPPAGLALTEEEKNTVLEEGPAPSKGRSKREKKPVVEVLEVAEEPKARGRKRLASSAEGSGSKADQVVPTKRRTKKDLPPPVEDEPEPVTIPKEKAKKASSAVQRSRGTKRLADSEITAALEEEEEVVDKPTKAEAKRTKKENAIQPQPDVIGDSELVEENKKSAPKVAARKQVKKSKDSEAVLETEPTAEAKPTKKRGKKDAKEEQPVPSRKRGQKANVEEEIAEFEPEKQESAPKAAGRKQVKKQPKAEQEEGKEDEPVPSRKRGQKASVEKENAGLEEVDGSKSMLAKQSGCGGAAVFKSLQNMLNFCFPASKATKNGESKVDAELDKTEFAPPAGKAFNLKISSWNVAGLRAWLKKDGLKLVDLEEPDIFCLQETKCSNEQLPEEVTRLPGYHPYWLCMPGGYAGVAVYSKIMPINVEYGIGSRKFDDAGRMITAEFEKFYLINVYVPNSGRKLVNLEARLEWEKLFQLHVQRLDALKPVVICGDMNVSHMPIDLANPKANTKNAGFTQEERDAMTELLSLGFVDTFRNLYPDRKGAYTFWTYMSNARARDVGWRLDYCIVSERFVSKVVEHAIRKKCLGSDHCPITIFFNV